MRRPLLENFSKQHSDSWDEAALLTDAEEAAMEVVAAGTLTLVLQQKL
jgi:hypothetical protein